MATTLWAICQLPLGWRQAMPYASSSCRRVLQHLIPDSATALPRKAVADDCINEILATQLEDGNTSQTPFCDSNPDLNWSAEANHSLTTQV